MTTDTEHPSTNPETHPNPNQATASSPRTRAFRARVRNGKIARLHKLQRDLVNRMLHNHVPYAHIVEALEACDILVTERNVSNWRCRGGYQEWCLEQERQLQLSRLQDDVTDYLRKHDATQLPEVGLQVASTHLTHLLLQPDTAEQLAADPRKYSRVVDMLCHLSTQIQSLQKDRNVEIRNIALPGSPEQFKHQVEKQVDATRRIYSSQIRDGSIDPEIPHRNELPPRDELPFQNLRPLTTSTFDMWAKTAEARTKYAALPEPQPQPAKK
jgi:hypothetical protein